jgi:hypothetical protein
MSWSLVAAAGLALALGGDFRHLSSLKVKAWWLLALALLVKLGLILLHAPATVWGQPLIFFLVAVGALLNWKLPGMPAIALGLLLNVLVVAANGGVMPYSESSSLAAGRSAPTSDRQEGSALSRPEVGGSRLILLDDRIPFPPTHQVFSFGDAVIMLGGVWLIVGISQARRVPEALRPMLGSR